MNKFKITAIVLSVISLQAATFDGNAAYEYGKALGLEVRARGGNFFGGLHPLPARFYTKQF